jgi:hypothetical protein
MDDVWTHRDLPVLRALVEHFDSAGPQPISVPFEVAGLDDHHVQLSLHALSRAGANPYIEVLDVDNGTIVIVTNVTERAYREVGAWPNAELVARRLLAELNAAADAESDPETKSKLKQAARVLGGTAYNILLTVAGRAVGDSLGL